MHFPGLGRKRVLEGHLVPSAVPPPLDGGRDVPAELRDTSQWILWHYRWRDGRWTKVPLRPLGKRLASVTDPTHWTTFEVALASRREGLGIGFVFTADDPYVGIDLDDCLGEDGRLTPWAAEIVAEFPT